jgi:hypothetical protein
MSNSTTWMFYDTYIVSPMYVHGYIDRPRQVLKTKLCSEACEARRKLACLDKLQKMFQ